MPKPVIRTPTPEQLAAMLTFVRDEDLTFFTYLRLAAVTGARPGEMCGLQWRDVDWATAEVDFRRRVIRADGQSIVKDLTKTGKTRRIPLDPGTVAILKSHHEAMEERAAVFESALAEDAFLFSETVDGLGHWRPDSVSRRFRTLAERGGFSGFTLYAVRHQAATTMIDRGIDAKTVSDRLGNSVATVLGTYTRSRTAADRAAADLLGQIFELDPDDTAAP